METVANVVFEGKGEQYRDLFENIPAGVYRTTPDGRILMANPALIRMLGYCSFEELASRNLEKEGFSAPYMRTQFRELLEKEGEVRGLESEWIRQDGSIIFVRESARAIRAEDGTVLYYEGIVEDITERKQMENALKENLAHLSKKNRYETIISTVTRSVHRSINLQEVLENAVDAMSENMGIDNVFISLVEGQEAVLKAYRGYPQWFIERVRRIPYPKGVTWRVIIGGKPMYCPDAENDVFIGPAGREVGTKSYVSMPIYSGGKAVGVININSLKKNAFDEEELKLLEIVAQQIEVAIHNAQIAEALRQSEERYRALFEQSPVGVYLFDKDFRITQCNQRMVQILQSSYDKIIGLDLRELRDKSFVSAIERVFEGQSCYQEGFYEATTSSARLWLSLSLTPLRGIDGNVIGGMAVVEDITERKRVEEEHIKAEKIESMGVLAGGIAHDFNNLLTSIMGNISLAKIYSNPDDKVYKRLDETEKACIQAKRLTQQLLTFSRGGAPIKKLCSIEQIIRSSVTFALRGSNVKSEFSIEDNLWNAEVDEGQMTQVITNLVINAEQAMPQGGVIRVKAENISLGESVFHNGGRVPLPAGRYVKITVEDQGIGIPQEHLPKIFDPYFTTKQKGSGLGLSTAYSIIKNHRGYIDVESELGKGSKFYIYIPASDKGILKEYDLRDGIALGKGRVLIMDDEEMIREIVGKMLNLIGYEFEFASDGAEAIEIYKRAKEENRPFDAVIMDLTIPGGMGGREAIEKLVGIDPGIRAIVSSGYSDDRVMSEYEKYGFKGVLSKPYTIEGLSKALRDVINGGRVNNSQ
jgi:PAS domain S-box-containing protein